MIFAWLQLKNIPFVEPIQSAEPRYILELQLAFYYLCWYAGTNFDVTTQEAIYVTNTSFPWRSLVGAVILLLVAAILLWASDNELKFSLVLTGFVVVNIVTWRILLHDVEAIIGASHHFYSKEKDYFAIAQLKIVQKYIAGNWQWGRFAGMAFIVIIANVICLSSVARQALSEVMAKAPPFIPQKTISNLLPEFVFFVFLVFAEGWIWVKRAITRASLYVLDQLEQEYKLVQR